MTPRRRVLAAAATGSTLGLAGCSALEDDGADADSAQTDDPAQTDDSVDGPAATVAVDAQEELEAAQMEIQRQVEEENLSQEEAQAEIQEAQLEILAAATDELAASLSDTDGLAVESANEQAGALLIAGDAGAIVATLDDDNVNALLSRDDFPEPQDG